MRDYLSPGSFLSFAAFLMPCIVIGCVVTGCINPNLPESFPVTETAEPAAPEQPAAPISRGCNCSDACPCGADCRCESTGKRCCFDCTCAPTKAMYCCPTCQECRAYSFPEGRPCEPVLVCPKCKGKQYRSDKPQASGAIRYRARTNGASRVPLMNFAGSC